MTRPVWSRSSSLATAWPTPGGLTISTRSSALRATISLAAPRPGYGAPPSETALFVSNVVP